MSGADAFKVEGVVVEVLRNGTYRLELANGHKVMGFVAGRAKLTFSGLRLGDKVKLQMSPHDLSQARIVLDSKKI
jgi:translation initiation factor IF-1